MAILSSLKKYVNSASQAVSTKAKKLSQTVSNTAASVKATLVNKARSTVTVVKEKAKDAKDTIMAGVKAGAERAATFSGTAKDTVKAATPIFKVAAKAVLPTVIPTIEYVTNVFTPKQAIITDSPTISSNTNTVPTQYDNTPGPLSSSGSNQTLMPLLVLGIGYLLSKKKSNKA